MLESIEPLMPNEETVAAMNAARRGELVEIDSIDGLLSSLNSEDGQGPSSEVEARK